MLLQQEEKQGATPGLPTYDSQETDMVLARQPQPVEEERIRQLNATSRTRNCVVCSETIPIPEFPALMSCEHVPEVCTDCYKSWIASELDSKSWKEIGCPESGCKQLLKHAEVQQYAAPEVYAK